ncbi:MAG: hypothetical protein R3320_01210 [Nitriliruptorales bacterium]|nr:hypothetical protein [Nitriliruptorales bacterium]
MATSDTETPSEETSRSITDGWNATRVLTVVVVVLVAGALAAGAFLVGDPARGQVDDPVAFVRSFYQEGDVAGLLAALAPGSIPDDQLEQAERDLGQLLQPQVEIVGSRELEVAGETLTEVRTSDRLTWCVEPDGTLYVRCRLGGAQVEVDAGDLPLEVTLSQADIYPENVELVMGVTGTSSDPFNFEGDIELEGAGDGVELAETLASTQGQIRPIDPTQFDLTDQRTMFFVWRGPRDAIVDRTLTVTWDGGSIELDVGEADLLS